MPYITNDRREALGNGEAPQNVGELTYIFSVIADQYLTERCEKEGAMKYQFLAEVTGALTNTSFELYRIVTSEFEDQKWHLNGRVFESEDWARNAK
jgi:hypothetical protein